MLAGPQGGALGVHIIIDARSVKMHYYCSTAAVGEER